MNKEFEKFHRDNKDIIANLLESLNVLLDKFNQGIIPGEPEKSNALHMLDAYKDVIDVFNRTAAPVFKRIKTKSAAFDDETMYKELSNIRESFYLLMKLGREKIVDTADELFQSDAGKLLLQCNCCDEVILESSGKHYYSLSARAVKALGDKNFTEKMRKDDASAIIPNEMILDADQWSNLYVRRIEILKQYYAENKNGNEYILFTLDDAKEMVFGCELNDSTEVIYTFAGIFDEKIEEHISQLKNFSVSGLIDKIVILVDSDQTYEMLEDEGIKKMPHISIERLQKH